MGNCQAKGGMAVLINIHSTLAVD